ncbi:hypothetical protein O181_015372 [Austropuccinia psidii MF-1]|uniref:Uncharacterized protein n=1 Tax=Austropuccinia psidii MF-1 TaxID=1389203 RepID=A0A9Q3C210_9BASI|nr:hypothetical protein [Austropuccinia psidii MF-1]
MPTPHMKHPSSHSAEIPSFDADYSPTSELDISALRDHYTKGTRVPNKMVSPSHGSLNAAEWALLYKVYIPFLTLSQNISLDEHISPNIQRKMGKSEDLGNEPTKNTFNLISAINIAASQTVSMDDETEFPEHLK